MNNTDRKKHDRLFQEHLIEKNPVSILGGKTEVIHHFIPKAKGWSIRWYVPNGIPLTNKQHGEIHGKRRAELEGHIIRIMEKREKGWRDKIRNQQRRTAKDLNNFLILNHIYGEIDNYIKYER